MRRFFTILLPILLCVSMLLASCGEMNPATNPSGRPTGTGEADTTAPVVTDEEGNIDENPFTVTLTVDGEIYIPSEEQEIAVRWNDGFALHEAPIGSDGVARVGGLDGDYRVSLTAIPDGYGYNPNMYTATNDKRNIEIELYRIVETKGQGFDLYNGIPLRYTGVYCMEITGPDQEVHYEFGPKESGTYAVESWTDVGENNINPYVNYYGANPFFKQFLRRVDDGGQAQGSYSKNFRLVVEIADENIGDGGAAAFSFGLKATAKNGEYPVKVYFAITLNGDFFLPEIDSELMIPQEPLEHQQDYDANQYEFVGAEFVQTVNGNTANVFDSKNYKLWPESEGGDNYYHLYDETKYSATQGYGPILYAKISSPTRFMENPFTTLEYAGNKALTLENGTQNYKLFIEGYAALNSYTLSESNPNGIPPYFCTLDCPCRKEGTNDSLEITGNEGCCITGCEKCHPDCRNIPEEAIGKKGYGDYTNADGCYAVTEELKDFLQKYSISQLLFFDGNGFVETNPTVSVYAAEDDQWLFACGYYIEKN